MVAALGTQHMAHSNGSPGLGARDLERNMIRHRIMKIVRVALSVLVAIFVLIPVFLGWVFYRIWYNDSVFPLTPFQAP